MGLGLDYIYGWLDITASSVAGEAGDFIPHWIGYISAVVLAVLIVHSISIRWIKQRRGEATCCGHDHGGLSLDSGCGHDHDHNMPEEKKAVNDHCGCGHDHSGVVQIGTMKPE
jgi:ABC-type nickel/cobalt efflux system permease component RcnA